MKSRRKKWVLGVLALYLAVLCLSHLKRSIDPVSPIPDSDQKTFAVVGYGEDQGQTLQISYIDEGSADGIPVLLIHGSPVGTSVFDALVEEFPSDLRVIAPDLPGHGNSTLEVSDGSFKADADYLIQLLDYLDIPSVHVVAYSRGGGPAIRLLDRDPSRVQSLVLLSSIGVQEQELLGNYTLNHAIHSLQLGFFIAIEELIPHFGYLDNAILNSDYARSFYDADQRPLRDILSRVEVPTLILHGAQDALVPLAAAKEHQRIIPQSEYTVLKGGHIVLVKKAGAVADHINGFVHRTESGLARARKDADPARILQAAEAQSQNPSTPASGQGLLFLAFLLFLATFASEDLTCVIAGILSAAGTMTFPVATIACFAGIVVGDLIIFFGGRLFGARAVQYPPFRWVLTEERLKVAQEWFHRRGAMVIFTTRFIPGSRLAVYFAAGMTRSHIGKFLLYFVIAAAVWTPMIVGLARLIGNPLLHLIAQFEHWALPALLGLIFVIFLLTRVVAPLMTHRGRRIFYGAWKRKIRWEFWPRWIFYPPVVVWVLWLGFRYRKPSLFTAVNPGIEGGGIAFESKRQIYSLLEKGRGTVARTISLSQGSSQKEWRNEVRDFQNSLPQPFPLVCKPDYGERGDGVMIARNEEQLLAALEQSDRDPLVQEFIHGLEYGIFFEKLPSLPTGKITSVTRKIHTSVTGDGTSTLDTLILNDNRAVCSYPYFSEKHKAQLATIPANGEVIELAELGSHCRGSLFLDGAGLLSPELIDAVNRIFEGTEGLCFGRLDLKCPSDLDLRNGQNLTVLEFNGLTSEPTHIYDPQHSLLNAYRTVFSQWKRAFEIAAENRANGYEPWSARETLRVMVAAMRGRPINLTKPHPS